MRLFNCNDLMSSDMGIWSIASLVPNLKLLVVEGLNCRITAATLAELGRLSKVLHHLCMHACTRATKPPSLPPLSCRPPP